MQDKMFFVQNLTYLLSHVKSKLEYSIADGRD